MQSFRCVRNQFTAKKKTISSVITSPTISLESGENCFVKWAQASQQISFSFLRKKVDGRHWLSRI